MCGIFGWQLTDSNISRSRRLVLSTVLSLNNDSRGGDSWGFYAPKSKNAMRGLGDLLPFAHKVAEHSVVLAHTRKRTVGAITVENAHPFEIGDIIGAHNGAIYNHSEMKKKYQEREKYDVDSMHLFAHLDRGLDFKDLSGYGSIEFVRKYDGDKYIFLCKMSSSADLAIAGIGKDIDSVKGIVWSSSERHLDQAMKAANIEYFKYEVKPGQVYYVQDGKLLMTDIFGKLELSYVSSGGYGNDWPTINYSSGSEHWRSRGQWSRNAKERESIYENLDFLDDEEDGDLEDFFYSNNTGNRYYKINGRWVEEKEFERLYSGTDKKEPQVIHLTNKDEVTMPSIAKAVIDSAKSCPVTPEEWDMMTDDEKLIVLPNLTNKELAILDKEGAFKDFKKSELNNSEV